MNNSVYNYLGHFRSANTIRAGHNTDAVGKKISILMHEGTPQNQAIAIAYSMKRAGRLTKEGGYKRVKK